MTTDKWAALFRLPSYQLLKGCSQYSWCHIPDTPKWWLFTLCFPPWVRYTDYLSCSLCVEDSITLMTQTIKSTLMDVSNKAMISGAEAHSSKQSSKKQANAGKWPIVIATMQTPMHPCSCILLAWVSAAMRQESLPESPRVTMFNIHGANEACFVDINSKFKHFN